MAPIRERSSSGPLSDPKVDAFLSDLRELEQEGPLGLGLAQLTEALEPVAPPPALRDRLLADVPATGRFARFAEAAAKLLDLPLEHAKALLDRIQDPGLFSAEMPGVCFYWCEGGPAVANAVRGFIRVEAGVQFPEHEHMGDETVLVLQGSYVDSATGRTIQVGETSVMEAGTSHEFYVPANGPDLLKLSVTAHGLRVLGQTILPRE